MADLLNVSYRAGKARILDDVTVRFQQGRFNVILGPNGAGKSTLLRVAAGLLEPSSGEVLYGSEPVAAFTSEALARKRAMLSQHVELVFPLIAEDVVLMGRYPHYGRSPSSRDRDIVRRALEAVGIVEKRAQPYPTLSSGEQQKVQLARVLAQIWNYDDATEHKHLFLDEPTSSLDIHYQIHLLDVARELLNYNCTVVAVLHDLNLALQYGDSFFVLDSGRLATATQSADEISQELLERVFQVRAHRIRDPETGENVWRFAL
jgi:iron complex transport system ATP-binding protein